MRTSLALICVLVFLATPYCFAYLNVERLLCWPEAVYRWFDPWLPLVILLVTFLITSVLPSIVGLFCDLHQGHLSKSQRLRKS